MPIGPRAASAVGVGLLLALTTAPLAVPTRFAAVPVLPHGTGCAPPPVAVAEEVPWAQRRLMPERVWELTKGEGVTVAVIDSGVDGRVPQLAGAVSEGFDVINGRGPANTDCFGHGTFVAGILAARPAKGTGFVGIAPAATVLPVRQANSASDGLASVMAKAIRTAADNRARVINISASATYPSAELESAVNYATERDVVIVAAAANAKTEGNPKPYPASYPPVVAVGAVGPDGRRAEFSQTGGFVDLVAPGVDVASLGANGPGHWNGSGTSYSAPFVSGVAALVRAYHPKLTAAQVVHRLQVTADQPGARLPDPQYGWGVVNPYAAVTAVLSEERGVKPGPAAAPAVTPPVVDPPDHLGRDLVLLVGTGAVLVVGLVWLVTGLGPAGSRRRWRPARVAVVRERRPVSPEDNSFPGIAGKP